MRTMSRLEEERKKSLKGGKMRGIVPGLSCYAKTYYPQTSDAARAYLADFCLVQLDKTIDLTAFDNYETTPGNKDYDSMAKIADGEKQSFL